jgi:signal transduction histidine kinase/phage shock protein PspC (stress-responsive transcriptional regulator)
MTTTPPTAVGFRRAYRDMDDRLIGGVAAGLAHHLGVPVLWVRLGFVVASVSGGIGIAFYGALWVMLPAGAPAVALAPGLESASRDGRRPGRRRRLTDVGPAIALGAVALGALLLFGVWGGVGPLLWPVVLGVVGVSLLWRQADEAQRERWLDATGRVDLTRVVLGDGGWASYARIAIGLVLMLGALVLFSLRGGSLSLARDITLAALFGVAGIVVVVGPWIYRLTTELADERAERVRTQERADVAAHLHDSVLQTLALIQKSPADAVRLARAQERDLRAWLYQGESTDERTVASALRGIAADTEDRWGITVDVVAVGDRDFDDDMRPIIAAAREAVTNAAKHAGVPRVDVYAEIVGSSVDVFVRDRGVGFDPDATPEDRLGVRGSIIDRMKRHGGRAEIRSEPGEGTEVRLHLECDQKEQG